MMPESIPESEVHLVGGAIMASPKAPFPPTPVLASVFWAVGALEILAGVALCAVLWPGDPEKGYPWPTVAYVPALTWLATGVISGCLFWALALGLTYLNGIYLNTISRAVPQARATPKTVEACLAVLTALGYTVTSPAPQMWVVKFPSGDAKLFFSSVEELQGFVRGLERQT
jgi:hypothetical protein